MKPIDEQIKEVIDRINKYTPKEFRESLIRAGIITKTGKLTKKYRTKK